MTHEQAYDAMMARSRVVAGESEDRDSGHIVRIIDDRMAFVAWDSGVQTPCPIVDLEAE